MELMPRWQRVYLAACAAVIGFAFTYVLSDFTALPRLTYYPVERAWRVVPYAESPVPMNYYGMIAWGLGGAAVVEQVGRSPRLGSRRCTSCGICGRSDEVHRARQRGLGSVTGRAAVLRTRT